ncbi:ester cyclase [Salipiger sp. 1_MG-2023]|uniref:nuclear transport factor 2 family protein n=1 Tax=Salipiger sp. 1_MG-2023 TaxID=3062665 RepID=UPI0026E2C853|nr:ester cyclase [Salipiger sp. 1_MG-2023]MDO6587545.1 ester cyclase [Salipiger sp. 1_MG-2023]
MRGQDSDDLGFGEFLRRVAETTWNRRGLEAALSGVCHPQLILRNAQGLGYGADALRADALELLAAMPDLASRSEDVIWSGNGRVGMLGSQRLLMQGCHDGAGVFGAATGKRIRFRVLTDIYAKDNRISEIWAVRDTGAILRQLGINVQGWARARLRPGDPDSGPFHPGIDEPGPYTGSGNGNQWGMAFAGVLERIMAHDFSEIAEQYDPAARLCYPCGVIAEGAGAAERFWFGLRAAFPSAKFEIQHRAGREDRLMPPRAALRWSLSGRHDGWGAFGKPTGAMVHVMGISHAEFGPNGIRREWTLYDEAAIWMQIHASGLAPIQSRAMAAE